MSIFTKYFTMALIKEIGDEDALVYVQGKEIVVPLTDQNREAIYEAVSSGDFLLPFDAGTNEFMMDVVDATPVGYASEQEARELFGATAPLENDEDGESDE